MTDGSAVHRPPPLREVLDAGVDLADILGDSLFTWAELMYTQLPFLPPGERARRVAGLRARIDDYVEHGRPFSRWGSAPAAEEAQSEATWLAWEADLLEDPALVERVKALLPEVLVDAYGPAFDEYRRPHPLEVRMRDGWWQCNNCGASFDQGDQEAVVVTDREGHSDLDYEITYCAACIALVAEVARQGSSS